MESPAKKARISESAGLNTAPNPNPDTAASSASSSSSLLVLPDVILRQVINISGVKCSGALACTSKVMKTNVAIADANRKTLRFSDDPKRFTALVCRASTNLVSLDLSDADWNDVDCKALANKLPKLQHLNLSGAITISSHGAKNLSRGGALISFASHITKNHPRCKDMKVTPAYIKAFPKLELTLGSKCREGCLDCLGEMQSLEALSLFIEGFTPLSLRHVLGRSTSLTHLRLKIGGWTIFYWDVPPNVPNSKLKSLVVDDAPQLIEGLPKVPFNRTRLLSFLTIFPLEEVTIHQGPPRWCLPGAPPFTPPFTPQTLASLHDVMPAVRPNMPAPTFRLRDTTLDINRPWNPIGADRDDA